MPWRDVGQELIARQIVIYQGTAPQECCRKGTRKKKSQSKKGSGFVGKGKREHKRGFAGSKASKNGHDIALLEGQRGLLVFDI